MYQNIPKTQNIVVGTKKERKNNSQKISHLRCVSLFSLLSLKLLFVFFLPISCLISHLKFLCYTAPMFVTVNITLIAGQFFVVWAWFRLVGNVNKQRENS